MTADDLRLHVAIWLPTLLGATFVLLFGACVGSFLNVLVWRLPTGQSVVSPPSRCPTCGHRLSWRENLPIPDHESFRDRQVFLAGDSGLMVYRERRPVGRTTTSSGSVSGNN